MLEEDEEMYFVEFFSRSLGVSALLSLFLAPMIPEWIAQWILVTVVVIAAVSGLLFVWIRKKFQTLAEQGFSNSTAKTLLSEEASTMFRVTGSTTLIIMIAIMWLGFAKMLWMFESFFVLFAATHIATSVVFTFLELIAVKGDFDEFPDGVHGTQPADDVEEAP